MKAILACDPRGGIGYNGKLPWDKIQGDLPRFKNLTSGQNVIMGRRTWESLPFKPLPNRKNYVLANAFIREAITLTDTALLPKLAGDDAWIIGGANVVKQCWDMITEIHLTKTFAEYTCDTFIDLVKLEKEFSCCSTEDHADHSYEVWKRR